MKAIVRLACFGALVAALILTGCAKPAAAPAQPTDQPAPTQQPPTAVPPTSAPAQLTAPAPTEAPQAALPPQPTEASIAPGAKPQADGVIGADEYAHQAAIGPVTVYWANDAQTLYLAMEGKTTGWISVGLDPTNKMQGANYVIGAVDDGKAIAWDAWGQGVVGPTHPEDTKIGGKNDILAYGGVEENGVTRFETQIPLDSGDQYDKPLAPGQTYKVITAVGQSDAFDSRHTGRASGEITLDAAQ